MPYTPASRSLRAYSRKGYASPAQRQYFLRTANRLERRAVDDGWEDDLTGPTGKVHVPRCWRCGAVGVPLTPTVVVVPPDCGDSSCCTPYTVPEQVCELCK